MIQSLVKQWALLAAVAALGCGKEDGRQDESGGINTLGNDTSAGSTETEGATESNDDDPPPPATEGNDGTATGEEDTDDTPKFDLGVQPDIPPVEDEGCRKVDFLFTIDNSGSMAGDQANLVANFPGFITGIQNVLETVDEYQVGVVTSDTYNYNVAGCQAISSLVVQTGGSNSSNSMCGPYAAGANYMTEADDLATAFTCAAQVGTSGSGAERQMQATVEAVQKVEGGPGQCNEGFIRDDALLVIVIITDESDSDSPGDATSWYNDVVAAKAGIPENVVVLALINPADGSCGGDIADGISAFTGMFGDNGFEAGVCVPDYAPFFAEAVGVIENACDNFMPPE